MYEHDPIVSNSIQQLSRERSNQHVRHTFKQSLLTRFPTKESFDAIKETCIQIMRERMDNHSEVWFESKYSILVNELYEEPSDILSGSISIELHAEMKSLFEEALLNARDKIVELQGQISNLEQSVHLSATQSGRGSSATGDKGGNVNGVHSSEPLPRGVADSCMESMNKMGISMDQDQLEEFKETICATVNDVHNGDSGYDNMRRTLNEAYVMRELRRSHGVTNVAGKKKESTISKSCNELSNLDTFENEHEKITRKGGDEDDITILHQHSTDGLIENITETLEQTHIDENFTLDCPICLETLCTDVTSKDYTGCCIGKTCGHALCSSCWKKNRKFKVCPVCRRLLFLGPGRRPDAHVY